MTNKRTLLYTLAIEVEVDGTPDHDDEVVQGVATEIQECIPGVLCDRGSFVLLVNSTELTPVSS